MNFIKYKYLVLGLIFIIYTGLTFQNPSWLQFIENNLNDVQYILRGSRQVSDKISMVYIGDDDLKALGEWPVTRDYYSYVVHILKSSGAKVIGIDVLFANQDKRHPEFDKTLANFLSSAGNVCLPMAFSELSDTGGTLLLGFDPTWPFKNVRTKAAATGFSNFSRGSNNKLIPIAARYNDSTVFSFGYELARSFIGPGNIRLKNDVLYINDYGRQHKIKLDKGRLLINQFGKMNHINTISFIDLFKKFQSEPDSINFKDQLVLVAVTATGITTLKKTALEESLPASLIHLTVAENLINNNYLTAASPVIILLILFLSALLVISFNQFRNQKQFLLFSVLLVLIYGITSFILFSFFNIILPEFLPVSFVIISSGVLLIYNRREKDIHQKTVRDLLQLQIELKETQLNEIKSQLLKESTSANEAKRLAADRKESIIQLEKEIMDLKIYTSQEEQETTNIANFNDIIYAAESPMADVLKLAEKVSTDDIPVLITGDTGTGKELIARIIHKNSNRKDKLFVAVNCGALPENLLESELFGHEKGSFTGASSLRKGRFEIADGGTIFLDEISETTLNFQAKLLRVLQEGTFERLGGEQTLKTSIRIIAATNKNIQQQIEFNKFRSDLYYRLNGFPIALPSLKDRLQDIAPLALHFLKKYNYELNISDQAMNILKLYHWPGNIRELENIIRRSALLAKSENRKLIQQSDLDDEIKQENSQQADNLYHAIEDQILDMLRLFKFSRSAISQTAKALDNRDRGTITEYFRGMCFEYLIKSEFNMREAARKLANTDEREIVEKVEAKIKTYLENLQKAADIKENAFKGLPKKYHIYLEKIFERINRENHPF